MCAQNPHFLQLAVCSWTMLKASLLIIDINIHSTNMHVYVEN